MQTTVTVHDDVEIMQLMGGFESYAQASELELAASVDAPASSPFISVATIKFTVVSVTLTVQNGC
ncbi:LxmA leader domain family RiPP [Streptomyces sp. MMS24-I29]|uniref:LxmA leader domain family RiPP n=1 Tax=Streptomyces sp. MMS24-I29 TaxID=3351480 RepID=UPI003C7E11D5